jgi:hypothetical protein
MLNKNFTQSEIDALSREDMIKLGVFVAFSDQRFVQRCRELFVAHKDIADRLHEVYEDDPSSHQALSIIEEVRSLCNIERLMVWCAVAAHENNDFEFAKWVYDHLSKDIMKLFQKTT